MAGDEAASVSAPGAYVAAPTGRELLASIPSGNQVGAIIDLVPGPALRRLAPTSAVAMLVVFGLVLVMAPSIRTAGTR